MKRLINASVSTSISFMEKPDFLDKFFNEYKAENYLNVDNNKLDFWNYNGFIDDLYSFVQTKTRSKIEDVEEAFDIIGIEIKEKLIDYLNDNDAKLKKEVDF